MKKRLRKKLRLGEFREYCFEISYQRTPDLPLDELGDELGDDFIAMIEDHGLQFGGGGPPDTWHGVVELNGRGTVTEEHRQIVAGWLEWHPRITTYTIGELVDAWHGW